MSGLNSSLGVQVLTEAFKKSVEDVARVLPDILAAIAITVLFFAIGVVLVRIVRRIIRVMRIDDALKPYTRYFISIESLASILLAIAIAVLDAHVIAAVLFPAAMGTVESISRYVARILSVVFLVIFTFIVIDAVVEKLRMERGLRGFMTLLTFLITTILIIDVTSLSSQVKQALAWGLSLGIGLSIGVFTAWYFFSPQSKEASKH